MERLLFSLSARWGEESEEQETLPPSSEEGERKRVSNYFYCSLKKEENVPQFSIHFQRWEKGLTTTTY